MMWPPRRRTHGLLALTTLIAFAGVAVAVAATRSGSRRDPQPPVSARTVSISCRSPSLGGQLPAQVYLPSGYASSRKRYRVIYFLHGLPATPESYKTNAFVADALADARDPAIVVAPQGARTPDSDREYLDWSATEDWPRAISVDLTACIDQRYRTIRARTGRALIGLSAGGYGALNIGLRNLRTFAAVESWSGYVSATDPSGLHVLQLTTPTAQRNATVPDDADLRAELARFPSLVAFYCGQADDRFADTNAGFDATLTRGGIAHVYRSYPGGHSGALWHSEAPAWLSLATTYLATGRTVLRDGS